MKIALTTLCLSLTLFSFNMKLEMKNEQKEISKNGMAVNWHFQGDRIYFEMSAPTSGWITIGFNNSSSTTNTYLLMGNVINNKANVVEYYTKSPGNYNPITKYDTKAQVQNISGNEKGKFTLLKFSLPIKAKSQYQRDLSENSEYVMLIAYSQEDDFQHHSIMRTSVNVKL